MKQYQYLIAALVVVVLTAGSGVVIGKMGNRWGPTQDSLEAAKKLEQLPEDFGNWKLQSVEEMTDVVTDMLRCTGYVSRIYVNKETGVKVSVAVIVGPTGPIAVHTPEVCFSVRDHKRVQNPEAATVGDAGDSFWTMTFESNDLMANLIRVYYGWTAGNVWEAHDNPRFSLASRPYIYKLQLATHLPAGTDLSTEDPCGAFLEEFIPLLKGHLVDSTADK